MTQQPAFPFNPSQFETSRPAQINQEANFIKSGLDAKETDLYNLQLIFLVDISGSMEECDVDPDGVGRDGLLGRGKWTRFDNLIKILKSMTAELIQFDTDRKLPVYFFNHDVVRLEVEDPNILLANARRYRPGGTTAMHKAFQASLQELNDVENFLYIVFTDGVPDDTAAVEAFIKNEIYKRDPGGDRINILFVRMGDDPGAMRFLQSQDDHPTYGDNVDHKSDNAAFQLGPKLLVLNAVYEEIERQPQFAALLAKYP